LVQVAQLQVRTLLVAQELILFLQQLHPQVAAVVAKILAVTAVQVVVEPVAVQAQAVQAQLIKVEMALTVRVAILATLAAVAAVQILQEAHQLQQ
jgi:hypothetical protein